ncbi:hypothetical protein SPONN_2383 [uncultured Candidatus Thioglobus sp.]|nr:hypothetical protein SPONN_2383 [uncultured Candidatus Thioglobus sp.]
MWKFVLIGDLIASGSLVLLMIWMSMRQSKEAQDYCMNIPLNDEEEVTGEKYDR